MTRAVSRNRLKAAYLGAICACAVGVAIGCARRGVPVVIPFAARFGDQPFSCTEAVDAGGGAFVARDLRFYVHAVQLLAADGTAADVSLRDDGVWQNGGVALLDFEDGTGNCRDGTKGIHTAVEGLVREGSYVGVRFMVGVPFDHNHANPAEAAPPLTLGHMHWGWQAGYKFLRFEGENTAGAAYRFHLGSTECAGTVGHITSCARPNRPLIELQGFGPGKTVALDLSVFMHGVDLAGAARDSVRGCMSGPDAADCAVAFSAIGLDPETGRPLTTQHVFSVL
jgi:uncharacterized repeat protein (TIGR04052 family)